VQSNIKGLIAPWPHKNLKVLFVFDSFSWSIHIDFQSYCK